MANRVNRNLAGRMNQYVQYRRRFQQNKASFTEALSNKSKDQSVVTAEAVRGRVAKRRTQKRGRRGRVMVARGSRPRQGRLKHITMLQAKRVASYAPIIQRASAKYSVSKELIIGVILQESGGNKSAVSHCGARGLMQLMPATAKGLGVSNSFDPNQNIMGGTKYLRQLLDRFDGNMVLALAGYNAGEGNVEKYGRRIPPFKETRAYVPNVLKYADTVWHILKQPVQRAAISPGAHHRTIFRRSNKV